MANQIPNGQQNGNNGRPPELEEYGTGAIFGIGAACGAIGYAAQRLLLLGIAKLTSAIGAVAKKEGSK